MRIRGKRWLSLMLTLCMILSFLPATAWAAGEFHDHNSGWIPLNGSEKILYSGNYYLAGPVTSGNQIKIAGNVTLCLNGYTYTGSSENGIFRVGSNGVLNIYDCGGTGKILASSIQNPIFLHSGGVCNLYGGTLQSSRTAVVIDDNGSEGGTLNSKGGTFNLYDGQVISTSSTVNYQGIKVNPYLTQAAVHIYNGTISSSRYGISAESGTVTLTGSPSITGGTADIYLTTAKISANGTLSHSYRVEMKNPGVFTDAGMEAYQNNFTSARTDYTVQVTDSGALMLAPRTAHSHCACGEENCGTHANPVNFAALDHLGGDLSEGNYFLSDSIRASGTIRITGNVILCLNGQTLNLNRNQFQVASNGSLTLCDCQGSGIITNGSGINGGAVLVENGGSFTMNDGKITGNTAENYGGGVYVSDNGSFTVSGDAQVTGNTANGSASNVYLPSGKTIAIGDTLRGAKIGITMASLGVFTSGLDGNGSTNHFVADDGQSIIILRSNGEAELHQHHYVYGVAPETPHIITESCTCGHNATATLLIPQTADLTYTGKPKTPAEVSYSGWEGGNLTPDYQENINKGTATAKISKGGVTATATFEITARQYNETDFHIAAIPPQTYTGSAITPDVSITFNGTTLKDTDYTLTYSDNIKAGTGKVTIAFQGNYTGTATVKFDITYASLPADKTLADYVNLPTPNENGWYNHDITLTAKGEAAIGADETTAGAVTIRTDGDSKQILYINDGTHIYQTEFAYKLDKTAPTISDLVPSVLPGSWTAGNVTVRFSAHDATSGIQNVTVTKDGKTTTLSSSDDSYAFEAAENGNYTVLVTDYAGNTATKSILIENIDTTEPGLTVTGGMQSGSSLNIQVQAEQKGDSDVRLTVKKDNGAEQSISNGEFLITEAGTYTFVATTGAGKAKTITKVVHTIQIGSDTQLVMDRGMVTKPENLSKTGYTFHGWYQDETPWDFDRDIVTDDLTLTEKWTLNEPAVELKASETTVTYGEKIILTAAASHEAGDSIHFTYEWYQGSDRLEGEYGQTLERSTVADSGSYTVTVTAWGDDGLTAKKSSAAVSIFIDKATPSYTIPAGLTATYGDTLRSIRLPAGWTWEDPDALVGAAGERSHAATFTPTDTDNFETVTQQIPVQVAKKQLIPSIVSVKDKEYDGTTDTTGVISLSGAVPGESPTASGTFTFAQANAGNNQTVTAAIRLDEEWRANYTLSTDTLTKTANITKKTVGLSWDGYQNLVYNGQPVNVTASATGLVGNDTCTVAVSGGKGTDAKSYTATATGLSNSNYKLPTVGTSQEYTIASRPVVLRWSESTFVYDGTAKTVTASIDNLVPGDKCQLTYQDNQKTEADRYTAKVTGVLNSNYTLEQGKNLTLDWSIAKRQATAIWQGLHQVYGDGQQASVLLSGLADGDSADDAVITGIQTTAGSHPLSVSLDNYEITNATATLVIQQKPVIITVTNNAAPAGSKPTIHAPGLSDGQYTITYKDKDGNTADLTQPGTYEVWVTFPENSNYRHDDGSSEKQVGTFIVTPDTPALYTASFDGNEATSGSMPDLTLAGGSILILPNCDYQKSQHQFIGWLYNGKIYQPGDSITMPAGSAHFIAQWAATQNVTGTVTDESGNKVGNAVVSIWQGSNKLRETLTDPDGVYTFEDLAPGSYNISVTVGDQTVTTTATVDDTGAVSGGEIRLPTYDLNSRVEVAPGSPDIIVDGLDGAFSPADQEIAAAGGKVEITVKAEQKQESALAGDAAQQLQSAAGGTTLDLYVDISLDKTTTPATGTGTTETGIASNDLLTITIPLPADMQDKDSYLVARTGEEKGENLSSTPDKDTGEYFELSEDGTSLILHVKESAVYAVGAQNTSSSSSTYPPAKQESENGSFDVSPSRPSAGQKVTITPKPDEGYIVGSVTVVDRNGKEIATSPSADGTYTFTQPSGSVTITVTFRKDTSAFDCSKDQNCPMAAFADADSSAWYHDGVHYCLDEGLMTGYTNGLFGPNDQLSRAMQAQILYNLENRPAVSERNAFYDVAADAWYADAVSWAAANAIVSGYGNGNYGPEDNITREQFAAILYRYAQYKGYDVSVGENTNILSYTDAQEISEYAVPAMQWACGAGIIQGYAGTLDPTGTATRAQAAAMLMRFLTAQPAE